MTWRNHQHLRFEDWTPSSSARKTREWMVFSKRGDLLGSVEWYGAWRQYVFEPEPDCVFNNGCLDWISSFLSDANAAQRYGTAAGLVGGDSV